MPSPQSPAYLCAANGWRPDQLVRLRHERLVRAETELLAALRELAVLHGDDREMARRIVRHCVREMRVEQVRVREARAYAVAQGERRAAA